MVQISLLHSWKLCISCSNNSIISSLKDYLTITSRELNHYTKRVEHVKTYFYQQVDSETIIVKRGLLEYVVYFLKINGIDINIEDKLATGDRITVLNKWVKILSNEKFFVDGTSQYTYLIELLKFQYGLGKFVTGYGKTELQLSIIDSFQSQYPDMNALICSPTLVIINEFINRAEKWDVKAINRVLNTRVSLTRDIDPTKNIAIIDPSGFSRSSASKSADILEWLSKVGLIVWDEGHHLSAKSWDNFTDKVPNLKFNYAFSGTPDKISNNTPTLLSLVLNNNTISTWNSELATVIQNCGPVRTEVRGEHIQKKVSVFKLRGEFSNPSDNEKGLYNNALDHTITSRRFIRALTAHITQHSNTYYMIIHKIESGRVLREKLIETNQFKPEEIVFMASNNIFPGTIHNLSELKEKLASKTIKLLITTTVALEGFDSGAIDAAILFAGKNVRFALQALGRARDSNIQCVLIYDTGNPLVMSQSSKKLKIVIEEYGNNIIENKFVNFVN